jgi:hypothetical protein
MSAPVPGEVVAAIMAAVAAREGRAPRELRLLSVRAGPAAPSPSPWALAGRLQQMRGISR